jgi:hypothetical protein
MLLAKKLVKKIMPNCIIFEATDGKKAIKLYKKQNYYFNGYQMPKKKTLKLLLQLEFWRYTHNSIDGRNFD